MFGQVVIGPPGSGKSTYCYGMYQFLSAIGRKLVIVNLDPANDRIPYQAGLGLDIRDFITIEQIMDDLQLGPNGGLLFAMENLRDELLDEFMDKVDNLVKESNYLIFDCPGQVELFTHDNSLFKIFQKLTKKDIRLCCVLLIDSIYLTSPSQYISILLLSLRSMLQMAMPQVNVISKIDKLQSYGKLPFRLEYYTEVQNLKFLTTHLEKESNSILGQRYVKLSETLAEIIEDYNLVGFEVLSVENKRCMIQLLTVIDKANGYSFGSEVGGDSIWNEALRISGAREEPVDIHERWIENKQEYDELELKESQIIQQGEDGNALTEDEEWELELKNWEEKRGKDIFKR